MLALTLVILGLAFFENCFGQSAPVLIGHTNDGGFARGLALAGNFLYLANDTDGLRIYDISNPTNPIGAGHTNDGGKAFGVAVSGVYVYLANGTNGLRVYNCSNPSTPIGIGLTANYTNVASDVTVSGSLAYVASGHGLEVYDVANPTNPILHGFALISSGADKVGIVGQYVCLSAAVGGAKVEFMDVSDPINPTSAYSFAAGYVYDMGTLGKYAFLGSATGVDIRDSSNPTNVFGYISGGCNALAVNEQFAYVIDGPGAMRVFDIGALGITPVLNPVQVGQLSGAATLPKKLVVRENFAYLADGSDGLRTFSLALALDLKRTATNSVIAAWSRSSMNSILQRSDNLGSSNWVDLTNVPRIVGSEYQVELSQSATQSFFRLKVP